MATQLEAPADTNPTIEAPADAAPTSLAYPDDQPKAGENLQDLDKSDLPGIDEQGDDQGAEGEEGEVAADPEEPEIEAPTSWAKDAKEHWANVPKEVQAVIAERESAREKFLQAKSREASQTRNTVESEARQLLQTVMTNHKTQLEAFMPAPEKPDYRLLQTGDPQHRDLYFQQQAAYDQGVAQREQITQQLQEIEQHTSTIASQQRQVELDQQHEILNEKLGSEWSDPSARAKLLTDLQPIAAELGYSSEVIAQANASDILALKSIAGFKAKADKYDQLMKTKMQPVRAAKQLPPAARPGATQSAAPAKGSLAVLYPDDMPRNR